MNLKGKRVKEIKQSRLTIVSAILAIIANYIIAVSFFLILCGSFGIEKIKAGVLCFFVIVPFAFYALRYKCKKILLFIGGHLLATVLWCGVLWIGKNTIIEWIGYQLLLWVYIIVSFCLKRRQRDYVEQPLHPAVLAVVLVVGFWILNYVENTRFQPVLILLLILFLGIYFAHYYLENYFSFIRVNKISDKNFQRKKLLQSGLILVGGYLGLLVLLLLFFTNPTMGRSLATGLKTILFLIIRAVLLLFRGDGNTAEPIVEESIVENSLPIEEEPLSGEPGWLAEIVDQILEIFLYVLFVAVVVAAVVWIVRKLRKMFDGKNVESTIEGEASVQDITESLDKEERNRKKQSIFYGMSANARIRKVYAKFMLGHKKCIEEELKKSLSVVTAKEAAYVLEADVAAQKDEQYKMKEKCLCEAALTYEKARYSEEECTVEELRILKKRLSKVRE